MRGLMCLTGSAAIALLGVAWVSRYPLDRFEYTGIRRLLVYRLINEGKLPGNMRLAPGATLPSSAIRLHLAGVNDTFDIRPDTPTDPELQAGLERLMHERDPSYRVALLDITDPTHPRYAAIRPDQGDIPGSVGKLLVMTGLFNELHRRYPDDTLPRIQLLRNTRVVADQFVIPNSHQVPVVNDDLTGVIHRAIRIGDTFSLWEWVDHMVSPSSNAAGSMVWKHALLLREFGSRYPPAPEEEQAYFKATPRDSLGARAVRLIEEPILALGFDTAHLRQRTFFTATASRIVGGGSSYSTPRQLVRWLLKLEQGRIVDAWSSLEMKRLLYFTRRRYRYAAAPALADAAVYFKSGSLYGCEPEPGYDCGQYRGNRVNLMHSVAIVESPARPVSLDAPQRVYLVSMMSNVLKVNSASEHATIAAQIEGLVARLHP